MAKRKKRWSYSWGLWRAGPRLRASEQEIRPRRVCKGQKLWIEDLVRRRDARELSRGADETQAGLILRLGDAGRRRAPAPRWTPFSRAGGGGGGGSAPWDLEDAEREVAFWKAALGADSDPTTLTQDDLEHVGCRWPEPARSSAARESCPGARPRAGGVRGRGG